MCCLTDRELSGLSYIDGGVSQFRWRFPIAFQIIPLLVLFAMIWVFPESPRWLVKVGREDEARYVLSRLRGDNGGDAEIAEAEFQDIRNVAQLVVLVDVYCYGERQTSYWSASAISHLVANYAGMDRNCRSNDL